MCQVFDLTCGAEFADVFFGGGFVSSTNSRSFRLVYDIIS